MAAAEEPPYREYRSFRGPVTADKTLGWAFDIDGYTVLPSAAPSLLLDDLVAAGDLLRQAPAVVACIDTICGTQAEIHGGAETLESSFGWDGQKEATPLEYVPDSPAALLSEPGGGWLTDCRPEERRRLGYDTESRPPSPGQAAAVWGLRIICCVGSAPRTLSLVSASHKSALPPPSVTVADGMGAIQRVTIMPGDCLVAAATTLVALPGGDEGDGQLLQIILAEQTCARKELPPPGSAWKQPDRALPPELSEKQLELMTAPALRTTPIPPPSSQPEEDEVDPELWFWDTFGVRLFPRRAVAIRLFRLCGDSTS